MLYLTLTRQLPVHLLLTGPDVLTVLYSSWNVFISVFVNLPSHPGLTYLECSKLKRVHAHGPVSYFPFFVFIC